MNNSTDQLGLLVAFLISAALVVGGVWSILTVVGKTAEHFTP
jgi:hypothetical protein